MVISSKPTTYVYNPPRRKDVTNPDRPWRDIPLSEFPASFRLGLSAEKNGGPPGPDWVCGPCICSSVSTDVERANFSVLWNRLCALPRPDMSSPPTDWAMIDTEHWTAGLVEFIFVRPGSEAHKLCDQIRGELAQFPDLMAVRDTERKDP